MKVWLQLLSISQTPNHLWAFTQHNRFLPDWLLFRLLRFYQKVKARQKLLLRYRPMMSGGREWVESQVEAYLFIPMLQIKVCLSCTKQCYISLRLQGIKFCLVLDIPESWNVHTGKRNLSDHCRWRPGDLCKCCEGKGWMRDSFSAFLFSPSTFSILYIGIQHSIRVFKE